MGFQVWKDEMECYQKQRLGQEPGKTAVIISQPKKKWAVCSEVCA